MTNATFPDAEGKERGYDWAQVDRFLRRARIAYDGDTRREALTAEEIRLTAFRVRRNGYSIASVDAALERLEEAFALREREQAHAEAGEQAWIDGTRAAAQDLLDRFSGSDGERFGRFGRLRRGYDPGDVDAFARTVVRYFRGDQALTVSAVRAVAFRRARGGYRPAEVDAALDGVIDVMLAVR